MTDVYGKILNDVYNLFLDYYGNILLSIVKTENNYDVYACKVVSYLNLQKYIFVIVRHTENNPEEANLEELRWVSFQTRSTDDFYNCPSYSLELTPDKKKIMSDELAFINRSVATTSYATGIPIKVTLLHDPKKKHMYQYPDKCPLYMALESYMCVIELL
jgi:hypothetical protein